MLLFAQVVSCVENVVAEKGHPWIRARIRTCSLSFFACVLLPEHGGPKGTVTRGADDSEAIRVVFTKSTNIYPTQADDVKNSRKINSKNLAGDPKRGSMARSGRCARRRFWEIYYALLSVSFRPRYYGWGIH